MTDRLAIYLDSVYAIQKNVGKGENPTRSSKKELGYAVLSISVPWNRLQTISQQLLTDSPSSSTIRSLYEKLSSRSNRPKASG